MGNKIYFLIFIIIVGISLRVENKIYRIGLNFNRGNLSFIDVFLLDGKFKDPGLEEGWLCKLISLNKSTLITFRFEIPNIARPINGGYIIFDKVNFSIDVPYFTEGALVLFYNEKAELKLTVNVSKFIKPCNYDRKCDVVKGENHQYCPHDCSQSSKDLQCEAFSDGICDPDCFPEVDPDCKVIGNENKSIETVNGKTINKSSSSPKLNLTKYSNETSKLNITVCGEKCENNTCQKNCKKKDKICGIKDGVCDPDCARDVDCLPKHKKIDKGLIAGAGLLLLIIFWQILKFLKK